MLGLINLLSVQVYCKCIVVLSIIHLTIKETKHTINKVTDIYTYSIGPTCHDNIVVMNAFCHDDRVVRICYRDSPKAMPHDIF